MSDEAEDLPTLACSLCRNFLSVFPIFAYEEQNTFRFTCGRCPSKKDVKLHRQIAYESSVQEKLFPCMYSKEGCKLRLCPGDLKHHEMYCESKPCVCPCLPSNCCQWKGRRNKLHEHYTSKHQYFVLNVDNKVELLTAWYDFENYYVWSSKGDLFLIYLRSEIFSPTFSYQVMCLMTSKSCKIEYNEGKKVYPVENFHDFKFKLETMEKVKNGTLIIKLRRAGDETVEKQIESSKLPQMSEDMLKSVECPICLEVMRPPVANCLTGHSLCQSCARALAECPVCRKPTSWGRNFALENLLQIIVYPCRGRMVGCPVALSLKEMETHEQNDCLFKCFKCTLSNCTWKNRQTKFIEHVQNHHYDQYIKGKPFIFFVRSPSPQMYGGFIDYDGNIFSVIHNLFIREYMCYVALVGPGNNIDDYEFEFQIHDPDDDRETLLLRRKCQCNNATRTNDYFQSIKLNSEKGKEKSGKKLLSYVRIMKKVHLDL